MQSKGFINREESVLTARNSVKDRSVNVPNFRVELLEDRVSRREMLLRIYI